MKATPPKAPRHAPLSALLERALPFAVLLLLLLGAPVSRPLASPPAPPDETVTVERPEVEIKDMAASYGEVVAKVKEGDTLTVLAHKGKWLNVKLADGTEGWVAETALAKPDSGLGGLADVAGRRDAKAAAGSDTSTAAKGGDKFDQLAQAKGWDKAKVYELEKRKVDPKEVRKFARDAKLGGGQ